MAMVRHNTWAVNLYIDTSNPLNAGQQGQRYRVKPQTHLILAYRPLIISYSELRLYNLGPQPSQGILYDLSSTTVISVSIMFSFQTPTISHFTWRSPFFWRSWIIKHLILKAKVKLRNNNSLSSHCCSFPSSKCGWVGNLELILTTLKNWCSGLNVVGKWSLQENTLLMHYTICSFSVVYFEQSI